MTAAIFILLLILGVPIAYVLLGTSLAYIEISGNDVLFQSFPQQLFSGLEKYGLMAIPLFMLAGEIMHRGGLIRRLIGLASIFVSGLRGGLAYINLLANMMMASIIGSATAQISIMTQAMVPEMERAGYSREFAAATTAAGGLLSPIIPPSMLFVIFGVLGQIAIGDLFIAGIIPGLLLTLGFILVVALLGIVRDFPRGQWLTRREMLHAAVRGLPSTTVPIIIVGGILLGIFSPTESAAAAALAAFLVGRFVHKELDLREFPDILLRTAINSTMVLFLIATANVFGWVIIFEEVPQRLTLWLTELSSSPFVFMLLVNAALLLIGAFIDSIAALIVVVPLLLPIAQSTYGIDPFHFGVVVCINLVLGILTPPVGTGLFISATLAKVTP
ncbi:MAG: TRAP transporter large permease, partial [Gammaproteobacteria bacterium]|nr:TRAP transporter large permease [Gammaproteobacteria bacterium]